MWVWLIYRWHVLFHGGFVFLEAASLWGPYKDIWHTVVNALWRRQPEAVHLLDMILKKHKPDFISLFKNPVGNFLLCFLDLLFFFFLNYFWRVIIFHIYLSIMWDVGVSMSWYTDGGKRATLVTSSLQCLGPRAWPQTAWQRISLLNHLTNTTLFVF